MTQLLFEQRNGTIQFYLGGNLIETIAASSPKYWSLLEHLIAAGNKTRKESRMPEEKKLVIIESPYAGETQENLLYLHSAIEDSLSRSEVPFASHGFYPQFLDDSIPSDRELGLYLGWEIMRRADLVAIYMDRGLSSGMQRGLERASSLRLPIEFRYLKKA